MSAWDEEDADGEADKVGYGRPPRHSQFKPGNTPHNKGNKRPERLAEAIADLMAEPKKVRRNGRTYTVTAEEQLLRLDIDRAVKGNAAAVKRILLLIQKYESVLRPIYTYHLPAGFRDL